ncbi:DNA polymerase ligase N-terminal domain-containing protein [Planctomicrobium sp. SH661]|uniref:DNA polymerase ligase N-terminal domain-containing protein n=1 Tax=Planctomicrobium sp. SH661 TaxID=3448124 RepID=UPI003F5C03F2
MPRYVILTHDWPFLHWDLMLETGETLRSWRLLSPPISGGRVEAESIPDHRADYLDYEGPVSGGRGAVSRWDEGECEIVVDASARLTIRLSGRKIQGALRECREGDKMWFDVLPPGEGF